MEFLVNGLSAVAKIFFDDILKGIIKSPALRNQLAKILCLLLIFVTSILAISYYFKLKTEENRINEESEVSSLIQKYYDRIKKESNVLREDEIKDGDKSTNLIYGCEVKKYSCSIIDNNDNKGLLNFTLQYSYIKNRFSSEDESITYKPKYRNSILVDEITNF